MLQSDLPQLPKPARKWDDINAEYQAAAMQLGQANYTKEKLDAEAQNLKRKMFELENEAAALNAPAQAAAPAPESAPVSGKKSSKEKRAAAIAKADAIRAARAKN